VSQKKNRIPEKGKKSSLIATNGSRPKLGSNRPRAVGDGEGKSGGIKVETNGPIHPSTAKECWRIPAAAEIGEATFRFSKVKNHRVGTPAIAGNLEYRKKPVALGLKGKLKKGGVGVQMFGQGTIEEAGCGQEGKLYRRQKNQRKCKKDPIHRHAWPRVRPTVKLAMEHPSRCAPQFVDLPAGKETCGVPRQVSGRNGRGH